MLTSPAKVIAGGRWQEMRNEYVARTQRRGRNAIPVYIGHILQLQHPSTLPTFQEGRRVDALRVKGIIIQ